MEGRNQITRIALEYVYGLGSFLDEKGIKWRKLSSTDFDLIVVEFDRWIQPFELWHLAIEFRKFQEQISR